VVVFKIIFLIFIILGFVYWLYQFFAVFLVIKNIKILEKLSYIESAGWPKISVLIPARNEEESIEPAVKSRLADDYPNFEIILIDDCSADRTPEIVDKLATLDPRIKPVHLKELPAGWIGKQYALHTGIKMASGDWFLFSDADVFIKPGTLKKAVYYCLQNKMDHLAVLPEFYKINFLIDISLSYFLRILCTMGRFWTVENEKSSVSVGSGSFNLVKRSAFEKTKGFEWIKMDVADDMAFGYMLKQSGARSSLVNGRNCVGVYFYRTMKGMGLGTERAGFTTLANFSFVFAVVSSFISLILELSPFIALIPFGIPHLRLFGAIFVLVALFTSVSVSVWAKHPIRAALLYPLGVFIMVFYMIRAGYLGMKRGGIYWRGRFYPTRLLKEGRRFRF